MINMIDYCKAEIEFNKYFCNLNYFNKNISFSMQENSYKVMYQNIFLIKLISVKKT
jgi:hypothetical protein